MVRPYSSFLVAFLLLEGCTNSSLKRVLHQNLPPIENSTRILAVYEPWFGHPHHISVGYSSSDPSVLRRQIQHAKTLGIDAFVVDWYGSREPLLDRNYALLQSIAAMERFQVAMLYDESSSEDGRETTDETLAEFDQFRKDYLSPNAPGREAYLTYRQRPMIFIFPKGRHTDWNRVREAVADWNPPPLLIYEYQASARFAADFDGFYAWINPGPKGWARDGSNWGGDYLRNFYRSMQSKYPGKIMVGTAWAGFDDSRASWGLNRRISQRCGATLKDTLQLFYEQNPRDHPAPFLLLATWNDYEEGTAIEAGLAKCHGGSDDKSQTASTHSSRSAGHE
jgi:hypothetical protein